MSDGRGKQPHNWKPGQSGNPTGIPRGAHAAAERMREFAQKLLYRKVSDAADAITVEQDLWNWALTCDDNDIRWKAFSRAQDYAYGKPKETVEHSGGVSINVNVVPVEAALTATERDREELTN